MKMVGAYKCKKNKCLEYLGLGPKAAGLQALQQPHKHSYSLKVGIHSELAHFHIPNSLRGLSLFFFLFLQEV